MQDHEIEKLEKDITTKMVKEIFQKKPSLQAEILDGYGVIQTEKTSNQLKLIKSLLNLEFAVLQLYENSSTEILGYVVLVYGGDGYNLINDHTFSMANLIKDTLLYSNKFIPRSHIYN